MATGTYNSTHKQDWDCTWTCSGTSHADYYYCASTTEYRIVDAAYEKWLLAQAAIKAAWDAFHAKGKALFVDPNPLKIVARAINSLFLNTPIKQPRWRTGRWKAKT